jgi:Flp pilus assembly pilin Flp
VFKKYGYRLFAILAAVILAISAVSSVAAAESSISTNNSKPAPTAPPIGQLVSYTSNPTLPGQCLPSGDFGVVLDQSGSINDNGETTAERNGVEGFVNAYENGDGSGLFALTVFSGLTGTAKTSGFVSASTFETAVNGLPTPNSTTPTAAGINTGAGNTAHDRSGSPNVMFVVTDGSPNDGNASTTSATPWLNAANNAINAANAARSAGWVVLAIYVGKPDSNLVTLFGSTGAESWVEAVMTGIGGGSFTKLSDFSSLTNGLLISVGCPTMPPTAPPTAVPTEVPTEVPTAVPTEVPTEVPTAVPTEVPTEVPTAVPTPVLPGHNQTCGGTVTFTNVPDGWYLVVDFGGGFIRVVDAPVTTVDLDPGTYGLIWHEADGTTIGTDHVTILACSTPTPTATAKHTPPPTDVAADSSGGSNNGNIILSFVLFTLLGGAFTLAISQRRRLPQHGQGLAEYALILALIAILAVTALLFLSGQINTILSTIGKGL